MKTFIKSTKIFTIALFLILMLGTAGQAVSLSNLKGAVMYKGGTETIHLVPDFKKKGLSERAILAYTYEFDDANVKYTYKSSNPSVLTVFDDGECASFYVKKAGKATVTFSFTYKGKKYSYVTKFVVKKWENPLKSLKIGKKSFTSKFKKDDRFWCGYLKGKIDVVPAKNWKLVSIKKINSNNKKTTYKNKSTVVIDYHSELFITLKNTKTNHVEVVRFLYPPFG